MRTRFLLLVAFLPSIVTAQVARPVRLRWGNLNAIITSDTTRGTLLWTATRGKQDSLSAPTLQYVGYLDPDYTDAWIRAARTFLAQRLAGSDSGVVRVSPALRSRAGDRVYLIRRRQDAQPKGKWSDERFIAFESQYGGEPLLVKGREADVRTFLDSLDFVNRKTFVTNLVDDDMLIATPYLRGAWPRRDPGSAELRFPLSERNVGLEGDVWVSYVVGLDGKADPATFNIVLSDGAGFSAAVRDYVFTSVFRPAERHGQPAPARLFEQYTFVLRRNH